jgi:hypothetical protein
MGLIADDLRHGHRFGHHRFRRRRFRTLVGTLGCPRRRVAARSGRCRTDKAPSHDRAEHRDPGTNQQAVVHGGIERRASRGGEPRPTGTGRLRDAEGFAERAPRRFRYAHREVGSVRGGEDRTEHSDAERRPEFLDGVVERRTHARVGR